jgi:MFS family permease
VSPSFWGPLSDAKGRRLAYCCTFVVFVGACVGLGVARSYAAVLVLRCVQSAGSASTVAIGSGVIGDITTPADRGGYMGLFQSGVLTPLAIGPVIGGAIAGSLGWRAIFWFLAIMSGAMLVVLVGAMPETLRSIVGNGGRRPSWFVTRFPLSVYQRTTTTVWDPSAPLDDLPPKKRIDVLAPVRIIGNGVAAPLLVFVAVYYAVWQMSITAMSTFFEERYGLGETQIGLTFIANGAGSMIGTLVAGRMLDAEYRRVKARHDAAMTADPFPLEKARMRFVPALALLQCASLVAFGWTIEYPQRVHIAAPIVTTFVTGWTAVAIQSTVMTYLVDVFNDRSAAASAALNLTRCLLGAAGTGFVVPLINAVGVGWTFTICVGVQLLLLLGLGVQKRFRRIWR